jgi:hypothetical protein
LCLFAQRKPLDAAPAPADERMDEALCSNPVLMALTERSTLLERAITEQWQLAAPCSSSLSLQRTVTTAFLESHLLVHRSDSTTTTTHEQSLTSVDGKRVRRRGNCLVTQEGYADGRSAEVRVRISSPQCRVGLGFPGGLG